MSTLTLNGNDLTDLTELSFLTGLVTLEQLTLADNPCILQPEDERKQFDYRPYVINWCLGLRVLDGVIVGAKERYSNMIVYFWAALALARLRCPIILCFFCRRLASNSQKL